jgi:hypothetical protein
MDPIVPPKLVAAHVSRKETHCNNDDGNNASHVCRDPNNIRIRIVWSVAKSGLDTEYSCDDVSDALLADTAMSIPNVSS